MAEDLDPLVRVEEMIESAQLSANDLRLLRRAIGLSLAPAETGRYVFDRISRELSARSLEDILLSLKDGLIALAVKSRILPMKAVRPSNEC